MSNKTLKLNANENQHTLVNLVCEMLGITKIESDAKTLANSIGREFVKETIRLAQKWAGRLGRRKIMIDDMIHALVVLQGSEFVNKIIPLIDFDKLGVDGLVSVQANGTVFIRPNKDVDLDAASTSTTSFPVEERTKSYFVVNQGDTTKSIYTTSLSEEEADSEIDEEFTCSKRDEIQEPGPRQPSTTTPADLYREAAKLGRTEQTVGLKPNIPDLLTVEQQMFMKDILTVCMGQDDKKRQEALQTLELDAGLQPILPSLIKIVCKSITANISQRCLSLIIYSNRILRAVCQNKAVELGPLLHDIIPALLSSMLGRNMCVRPEIDNHWALRDYSVKTLLTVYRDHISHDYLEEFRKRVFKFAYNVFKCDQSTAPMIYGTIVILTEFVEEENIEKMASEFAQMNSRQRKIHHEMLQRPNGAIAATEAQRLFSHITKHEALLKQRLNKKIIRS